MKFDCIIMNPPYGSRKNKSITLHDDITNKALELLNPNGKCISLMPITLIKSSHDRKKSIETKKLYDLYLKEIVEIDGNELFDTSMKSIAIYDFEKNKNLTDNINIKTFKKSEIAKSLFDFDYNISNNEKNILNKLKTNKSIAIDRRSYFRLHKKEKQNKKLLCDCIKKFISSDKVNTFAYFIPINLANGGMNAQWQSKKLKSYKLLKRDELHDILLNDYSVKAFLGFKENELQSALNILKLIECNCLRYPLLKTQDDQNLCPRVYKYFPDIDYTNIDTEEKFYKHFNITSEEQKIIEETMKKYEI